MNAGARASAEKARLPGSARLALGVLLVGVFIGALDTNVIGPAFPLIMRSFRVSLGWVAWTVTAYTVAYVATTVFAGALGDRRGRRRVFAVGLVLFGVASLLAALARTFPLFLLARLIQGAGAGAVYPNAQAEGVALFPEGRRGLALGIFGAAFGVASIVGPNVGGLLAQYVGWPSIFLLNVPIVLLALVELPKVPESLVPSGARPLPDILGGLTFAGGLAGLLLALATGGVLGVTLTGAAVVLFVLFVWRQRRADVPFLDTEPIAHFRGAVLVAGAALIGLNMSAAVFIPTLVQRDLGFSVAASGVALMPAALSGAVLAGVGGVLVDRLGARTVLLVGLLTGVVGGVLLMVPHMDLVRFLLAMVAFGVATAFTMGAPLNRMALQQYREESAGEALSLVAVFRSVGIAAGPVLLTLAAKTQGLNGMFGVVALASAVAFLLFLGSGQDRRWVARLEDDGYRRGAG